MGFWRRLGQKNPRWALVVLALIFVAGSSFYLRKIRGQPVVRIGADGRYHWAFLTSLVLDRDLDLENQYANKRSGNYFNFGKTETGRFANVYPIGPALAWTPMFLVAHGLSRVFEGAEEAADGTSFFTQTLTLYSTFLYAFAALCLVYRALRDRYGPGAALAGAVAGMVCGPVIHYILEQPHYSHALSASAVAALLVVWDRGRGQRTFRGWLLLGALAGAAALMRPQNAIYALPAIVEGVLCLWRRQWRGPVAAALVAVVVFLPQMIAWKVLGHWLGVPQGEGFMRWGQSAWSETLFSSRNGLFPYAPVWLIGLAGVAVLVVRRDRWLGVALLGTFALAAFVNGAAWDWWGAGSFGGRRYDGLVYHVAIGMAAIVNAFLAWIERRPRVAGGVLVAAAAVLGVTCNTLMSVDFQNNIGGAQQESTDMLGYYQRILGMAGKEVWRLGNPLSWPAAWMFALRTGAPPSTYDVTVGPYVMDSMVVAFMPHPATQHGEISFVDTKTEKFIAFGLGGWAADKSLGRPVVDRRARVMVPLNIGSGAWVRVMGKAGGGPTSQPASQPASMPASAPVGSPATVIIRWNGDEVGRVTTTPGQPFELKFGVDADRVRRGINLVDLVVEGNDAPDAVYLTKLVLDAPR